MFLRRPIATVAGDGSGDGPDKALTVFMCEECNSVFLNQDTLAVHILAEHMPKETNLSAGKLARVFYLLFPALKSNYLIGGNTDHAPPSLSC